jgi:predicted MFS family arabinose efflux permease
MPAIVVALAALAAHRFVPESPVRHPGRISWLAAGLLSAGLVLLLLALSTAPDSGWTSGRVIALMIASVVALVAWVLTELRSRNPLIDMRMMRLPAVWTTNLVALLFGAGQFAIFAFLPQFVQTSPSAGYGFGSSVTEAGVLLLPMVGAMFVAGIVSGRVEARFSSKAQLVTASTFSVLAFTALAFAHNERVTANLQPSSLPDEAGYTTGFLLLAGISVAAVVAALIVPSGRRAPRLAPQRPLVAAERV